MTPGPTPAPPEVLAAVAQPVIHHRGPDYKKLYAECLARLREVFRTESEVLLFGASGTGAMESADTTGVRGKGVTPYLLKELATKSGGRTLKTNIALLVANARLAAGIAAAYSARKARL